MDKPLDSYLHEPVISVPPLTEIRRRPTITMRDPQQSREAQAVELADLSKYEPEQVYSDAKSYAEYLVDQARETAASMVEQARMLRDSELDAARQKGYQEGYEAGYSEGISLADRESAGLIRTAEQIAMQVAAERNRSVLGAERDVVELAIEVARKLVAIQIELEPDLVVEVCRGAIRKAFNREQLVVLAHPDDMAILREAGGEIARELGGIKHLDFVEERRVERGSVLVRTPGGEVDATFDGKADKIRDAFRDIAERRRAGSVESAES